VGKKKKHFVVIAGDGDPCPRCGRPTQIREHPEITDKQLRQPFYYSRWFNCINPTCKTTLVMPDRFRVFRNEETRKRFEGPEPDDQPPSDIVFETLDAMAAEQQRTFPVYFEHDASFWVIDPDEVPDKVH
jgi:hypothetical protein